MNSWPVSAANSFDAILSLQQLDDLYRVSLLNGAGGGHHTRSYYVLSVFRELGIAYILSQLNPQAAVEKKCTVLFPSYRRGNKGLGRLSSFYHC